MFTCKSLLKICFEYCISYGFNTYKYIPSHIQDRLLVDTFTGVKMTSECFKKLVLNYACNNGEFKKVLRVLLQTNICEGVEEMVDDEECVYDVLNVRERWSWENVFDFIVYVKVRDSTNTQYIFFEFLKVEMICDENYLCRFCSCNSSLQEVRVFSEYNQHELNEVLLDYNNYCARCSSPLFKITEITPSTLCYCEEI